MAQGNYDHPSYLTRQQIPIGLSGTTANGTFCQTVFPSNARIRNVVGVVTVAGTTSGAAAGYTIRTGTTSVGAIVLSTNGINFVGSSGDINATLANGGTLANVFNLLGGADTTVRAMFSLELYLDPSATWTGQN